MFACHLTHGALNPLLSTKNKNKLFNELIFFLLFLIKAFCVGFYISSQNTWEHSSITEIC